MCPRTTRIDAKILQKKIIRANSRHSRANLLFVCVDSLATLMSRSYGTRFVDLWLNEKQIGV